MTPRARSLSLASLLFAALTVFALATDRSAEAKSDVPCDEAKAADPTKSEAQPGETSGRPAPADAPENDSPPSPPAAAPSRDAVKPTRPANKPRPAWPPPPELIS
jgi:hypothetical protein